MNRMNISNHFIKSMVLLTTFYSIPFAVMASTSSDGLYAGANMGWSQYYSNNDFTRGHENNDIGVGGYIGYQLNPYFSLENGILILGDAEGDKNSSMTVQGYQLSGKISYPVSNTDIYTRLGGMWYRSDYTRDDTNDSKVGTGIAPLISLGIEYTWNYNITSRVEYQWVGNIKNDAATSANVDNGLLSVGFSYHFGAQSSPSTTAVAMHQEQPAAAPVVPQSSQELSLFYGFNEYTLTHANQQKIIDYFHDLAKHNGSVNNIKLSLHGYSDTLGSEKNNNFISKKRAEGVKRFLLLLGMREENITVKPEGSTSKFTEQLNGSADKETEQSVKALAKNRQTLIISY